MTRVRRRRVRATAGIPSDSSSQSESESGGPSLPWKLTAAESALLVPFFSVDRAFYQLEADNLQSKVPFVLVITQERLAYQPLTAYVPFDPFPMQQPRPTSETPRDALKKLLPIIQSCSTHPLTFHQAFLNEFSLVIVTADGADKFLFLDMPGFFACLRIGSNTTTDSINALFRSCPSLKSGPFFCFASQRQVGVSELCGLPSLSAVSIVNVSPVTWVCCYSLTHSEEYRVVVKGVSTDSLLEMKQSFLKAGSGTLGLQGNKSCDEVWFVHQNEVVTDTNLHQFICRPFIWPSFSDVNAPPDFGLQVQGTSYFFGPATWKNGKTEDVVLKCSVFIKPANAVAKRFSVQKAPERLRQRNTIVILAPDVTKKQLRRQISKVLQQKPGALQITVGKQVLEDVKDLPKQLFSSNAELRVRICSERPLAFSIRHTRSQALERNVLHFHPFDSMGQVKRTLCSFLRVPQYKVDFTYQGHSLADEQSIHSCRIQNETEIDAELHESRVILKLWVSGETKSNLSVLVDDVERSTVGDLKQFIKQELADYSALLDTEMAAIFQNQALRDADTLSEAGIWPERDSQTVVFKRCQSLCFSATSAAEDGTFYTLQGDGDKAFLNLLTMTNGQRLFTSNVPGTEQQRRKLLQTRKGAGCIRPFTGIRVLSPAQTADLVPRAQRPHKTQSPPAVGSQSTAQNHTSKARPDPGADGVPASYSQRTEAGSGLESLGSSDLWRPLHQGTGTTRDPLPFSDQAHSCFISTLSVAKDPGGVSKDLQDTDDVSEDSQESGDASEDPHDTGNVSKDPRESGDVPKDLRESRDVPKDLHVTEDVSGQPQRAKPSSSPRGSACISRDVVPVAEPPHQVPSTSRKRSAGDSKWEDGVASPGVGPKIQCTRSPRRKTVRKTVIEDSMDESDMEQGVVQLTRSVSTTVPVGTKDVEKAWVTLMPGPMSGFNPEGCLSPQVTLPITQQEVAAWSDAKFKYINKKVVYAVARELGFSGYLVLIELGVPKVRLDELQSTHGQCSQNLHLHGLIAWCQMAGPQANAETLKTVLRSNDRLDLVQIVDDIISGKRKLGYETS